MDNTISIILYIILGVVCAVAGIAYSKARLLMEKRKIARMLVQGALIVDVREKPMYEYQHYPNAINIPEPVFFHNLQRLGNRDSSIVIYCSSGYRSEKIVKRLKEFGYTNVVSGRSLQSLPPA